MTIKAFLFDCDGTLVDSELAHYQAYRTTLQSMGHDLTPEEYPQYSGTPDPIISRRLATKIGADCADLILQKKRTAYHEACKLGLPTIAPTVEFLKSLGRIKARLGIKLGVCSAAKKEAILTHLAHMELLDILDVVLSGEDDLAMYRDPEGVNKPKPYIYQQASVELAVKPSECMVFEDSHPGVLAGVSAGCFTVAIPNSHTRHHDFSSAHLQLSSLSSVTVEDLLRSSENRG